MAAPTLASPELVACPVADEILVERIRSGEQDAFGELYERYFTRIFHFVARRLRNRADTEETVQEVFVNVFASIDSFRGEAPFGAWVFGLTRRTVAGRFKKRMPNLVPLGDDEAESGDPTASRASPTRSRPTSTPSDWHASRGPWRPTCPKSSASSSSSTTSNTARSRRSRTLLSKSEDAVKSHLYRARKVLLAS